MRLWIGVLAALVVVLAGCGGGGGSSKASRTTTLTPKLHDTPPKPKSNGKLVTLHRSKYGTTLADGRGLALYLFTRDERKSRCYGKCAESWPPFLTKGQPRAGGKVRQELLGSVKRTDGRSQVTYKGHPLYYYVGDRLPGQVLCQAVLEYGGYWYVVNRKGAAIR